MARKRLLQAFVLNIIDSGVRWETVLELIRQEFMVNLLQVQAPKCTRNTLAAVSENTALVILCIAPGNTGHMLWAIESVKLLSAKCPKAIFVVLTPFNREELTNEEKGGLRILPERVRYLGFDDFVEWYRERYQPPDSKPES